LRREIPTPRDEISRTRAGEITGERIGPPLSHSRTTGSRHLLKLIDEVPKFKSAQIRRLWPQIKAALREGHTLKRIWECLNDDGVQLSYAKLRWHVATLRRLESEGVEIEGGGTEAQVTRSITAPTRTTSDSDAPKRDPLANLRERMNKRPGFEFDERPPDPRKLL